MNLFLLSRARLLIFSAVYGKRSQSLFSIFFSTHMKIMSGRLLSKPVFPSFSFGMFDRVLKTILDFKLNKIW